MGTSPIAIFWTRPELYLVLTASSEKAKHHNGIFSLTGVCEVASHKGRVCHGMYQYTLPYVHAQFIAESSVSIRPTFEMLRLITPVRLRRFRRKKHFKSATTGVATKTMRNELNRLVQTVHDPNQKRVSNAQ